MRPTLAVMHHAKEDLHADGMEVSGKAVALTRTQLQSNSRIGRPAIIDWLRSSASRSSTLSAWCPALTS